MSITRTEALALLNPLTAQDVTPFFRDSLSPNLKWTYGAPGATHALAGTYDGLGPFVAGTWARLAACFDGERSIKLQMHVHGPNFETQIAFVDLVNWGSALKPYRPIKMEIDSLTLDAEASRAAIEVRTTGKARARPDAAIDNVGCWLVRFAQHNEADGRQLWKIVEITSFVDSALIVGLLERSA